MNNLVCAHCMAEVKQKAMMDNPDPPCPNWAFTAAPLTMFGGQVFCWKHLPVLPPMTEMEAQRADEVRELFEKFFGRF